MFIYIVDRDPKDRARFIDKYVCKGSCEYCYLRFGCFTKGWRTFRHDYGVMYERSEIAHIPITLSYCCRLVVGKVWDELLNKYVPEI